MSTVVSYDEADHDARRARQWLAGQARDPGVSRAELIALGTAMSALAADDGREPVALAAEPVGVDPGIVKPLDPALLTALDGNAELRWEAMAGQGYVVPNDRFFVRNHTHTPRIDAGTWRLRLHGDGLRGAPTRHAPVEVDYATLRAMPAVELPALVECAGNGRHFFASQQDTPVSGVQWRLGGVGVARWRGCRWPPCSGTPG